MIAGSATECLTGELSMFMMLGNTDASGFVCRVVDAAADAMGVDCGGSPGEMSLLTRGDSASETVMSGEGSIGVGPGRGLRVGMSSTLSSPPVWLDGHSLMPTEQRMRFKG